MREEEGKATREMVIRGTEDRVYKWVYEKDDGIRNGLRVFLKIFFFRQISRKIGLLLWSFLYL